MVERAARRRPDVIDPASRNLLSIPNPHATRLGCATVYVTLYGLTMVFAVMSLSAPGGGIPFVLPWFLGLPWTLIASVLFLVPQLPKPVVITVMFVLPPVINMFLIVWERGTAGDTKSFRLSRSPRTTHTEARRPLDDD